EAGRPRKLPGIDAGLRRSLNDHRADAGRHFDRGHVSTIGDALPRGNSLKTHASWACRSVSIDPAPRVRRRRDADRMMRPMTKTQFLWLPVLATCVVAHGVAAAEPPVRGDVEVDPTAYVLSGYSVHVGVGWTRLRVDLGAFAIAVPRFVHGNDGFSSSVDGLGVKLQYFPFAEEHGGFVGVDAGFNRQLIRLDGTDLAAREEQLSLGAHVGWRFEIGPSFYATPWIGLSYGFNVHDV